MAEFALGTSLVSLSLVSVVKEEHVGIDAGKWVHVVQGETSAEGEGRRRGVRS